MMGLSNGERILMMRSAVLTQITRVPDRQTDGIGMAYTYGSKIYDPSLCLHIFLYFLQREPSR